MVLDEITNEQQNIGSVLQPQLALMPLGNDYAFDTEFQGYGKHGEGLSSHHFSVLFASDEDGDDEDDMDDDESFDDMEEDFDDDDDDFDDDFDDEDEDFDDEDEDYDYEEDVDYDDFDE
ncbi:MAG: hypothetical protein LBG93_08310 [Treponema sp.]|nr:hypothetical protein [Treponema sp.]